MGPSTERRGDDGVRVAVCGRQDGMIDERTNSGRAWASGKGVWLGEIRVHGGCVRGPRSNVCNGACVMECAAGKGVTTG